jgi:hypothetical protein
MNHIRWAIVGTGYIANSFAQGMQVVEDAILAAVVSRNEVSARTFAQRYGGESVYTDYAAMLKEVKPDVVYIAIPNDLHYDYSIDTDGTIIINVEWGDWKHDHQFLWWVMKKNYYRQINCIVTEEDGSDTYSAEHYYKYGS